MTCFFPKKGLQKGKTIFQKPKKHRFKNKTKKYITLIINYL